MNAARDSADSPVAEGHKHGGPSKGEFARAAEAGAAETGLRVVRLTVDLFRSVPRVPLALTWHFVRRGRRIAVIQADLTLPESGDVISRASSVLLLPSADTPRSWKHTPAPPLDLAGDRKSAG